MAIQDWVYFELKDLYGSDLDKPKTVEWVKQQLNNPNKPSIAMKPLFIEAMKRLMVEGARFESSPLRCLVFRQKVPYKGSVMLYTPLEEIKTLDKVDVSNETLCEPNSGVYVHVFVFVFVFVFVLYEFQYGMLVWMITKK